MGNFFQRYVVHNLGLKLFSLVMAVLLWGAVARDPVVEDTINVPIEFHRMPEDLEISSASIPQAQVRLSGPAHVVHELKPTDVRAEIDLAGATTGLHTFELSSRNIRVPRNLRIVQIVPAEFNIDFDRRKSRMVEVRPRVIGTFATGTGLHIAQVIVDPPQVTITGPAKNVDAVDAATTDPVDATGLAGRRAFVTNAYVSDPLVQVAGSEPVRVTVVVGKSATGK